MATSLSDSPLSGLELHPDGVSFDATPPGAEMGSGVGGFDYNYAGLGSDSFSMSHPGEPLVYGQPANATASRSGDGSDVAGGDGELGMMSTVMLDGVRTPSPLCCCPLSVGVTLSVIKAKHVLAPLLCRAMTACFFLARVLRLRTACCADVSVRCSKCARACVRARSIISVAFVVCGRLYAFARLFELSTLAPRVELPRQIDRLGQEYVRIGQASMHLC